MDCAQDDIATALMMTHRATLRMIYFFVHSIILLAEWIGALNGQLSSLRQ